MSELSKAAQNLNWLVANFVKQVPGVAHAVVVSSDGVQLLASEAVPKDRGDQLAAVASGLASLTQGAANLFEAGSVTQTVVDMLHGFLFVTSISDGSVLAVLASPTCDMKLVGYEMTLLVERTGDVLTPALRAELQSALAR
ncbi:roadblock/LC7 domain-containing protein [Streptomyces sp. SL13]|uniref:Roadblock/LC7 domain-containing protein n=1 Tax=Streptantibioticus silvisoli TaxID=2705255 RepID=A0AA90KFP0_9ACTN|nr:roadblock/LC7 domain-containing protein [Streptantibioticus silvisoli]MDI5963700.1 roadblock/LC7 domain-containing protein [Streptantibioticus silvisoli]MDI5969540.1 roadblock/LC7 domain-containing protein [Streptantibioticus silvisoli]